MGKRSEVCLSETIHTHCGTLIDRERQRVTRIQSRQKSDLTKLTELQGSSHIPWETGMNQVRLISRDTSVEFSQGSRIGTCTMSCTCDTAHGKQCGIRLKKHGTILQWYLTLNINIMVSHVAILKSWCVPFILEGCCRASFFLWQSAMSKYDAAGEHLMLKLAAYSMCTDLALFTVHIAILSSF